MTEPKTILDRDPSDVFEAGWVEDYRRRVERLHDELALFNSYLFVAEHIARFPWGLLYPMLDDRLAWLTIASALTEGMVGAAYRITIDSGKDVLTIPKLKKEILVKFRREEDREEYQALLRARRFGQTARSTRDRIRELRRTQVGHLVELGPADSAKNLEPLSIEEYSDFAGALNRLFDTVSIGTGRAELPLAYYAAKHPAGSRNWKPDIERLLELVARASAVLSMADREPEFWPIWRDRNLPAPQLAVLNDWRHRLGLPPA